MPGAAVACARLAQNGDGEVQISARGNALLRTPDARFLILTAIALITAMFVGMALRGYARLLDGREAAEMLFTVSFEDERQVYMQTACRAGEVAWAAFHLAIAAHPNRRVVLRHSGRIIGEPIPILKSMYVLYALPE